MDSNQPDNQEREDLGTVLQKLADGARMERILHSEDWEVFHNATHYLAQLAAKGLKMVDPKDTTAVLRFQIQQQFYEDVIPNIIQTLKLEAEQAYEEGKERGWLEKIRQFFALPH